MRQRCHISNADNIKTDCVQGSDCRLSAGARASHLHRNTLNAVLLGLFCCPTRCHLCCKRCTFARTFESYCTCTRPTQGIACWVSNGNYSIVERRTNVGNCLRYFFLYFLACFSFCLCFCHVNLLYFFICRLGPLRVRALVLVRCPCTGNPLLCRMPL